ncbi:MAG: DUF1778 domain-containing protein [Gemmatimonadales bacterium]
MAGRTSQLQIRVSPEQKSALKRLAAAAGMNVSAYVLSRALPSPAGDLTRAFQGLRGGGDGCEGLLELASLLAGLETDQLRASMESVDVEGLTPVAQNRIAGLVEDFAGFRGVEPPGWASAVEPLPRPHFRWPLVSLWPYQLRVTRAAYKRRNVFDPHMPSPATGERTNEANPRNASSLAKYLLTLELDVEFYFVAGAVLVRELPARPRSARPAHLFGADPAEEATNRRGAVRAYAATQGWEPGWEAALVREITDRRAAPVPFLDLPHLQIFAPPPEYALALVLGSLGPNPAASELDDLRFLLRSLNLASADAALASVGRYVAQRHLPAHAKETLRRVVA